MEVHTCILSFFQLRCRMNQSASVEGKEIHTSNILFPPYLKSKIVGLGCFRTFALNRVKSAFAMQQRMHVYSHRCA